MTDIAVQFAPAKQSVGWAEDAVSDLKSLTERFFQVSPAEIVTEFDTHTGEHVQKVRLTEPLPSQFARKATEALNNARHAFDQAAFAARSCSSGASGKSVYFPWAQSQSDLDHLLKSRGIDQRLWDIFKAHEPYARSDAHAGGNDMIRALATLANNKHTVGLAVAGHIASTRHPDIRGGRVDRFRVLKPRWDAVKNEAELLRWIGEAEVDGDYQIRFEIVFKDARLAKPVNAIGGLSAFTAKAKALIEDLQGRCAQLSSR